MDENRPAAATVAVLAGGRSRRMGGGEKALIRLGGATLLERVLTAARPLGLPVRVVAGTAPSPQLRAAAAAGSDLGIAVDRYPGQGPLGGILTAFEVDSPERVLALACDLPFLTAPLLEFLLEQSQADCDAAVPEDRTGLQPLCAVYRDTCRPLLQKAVAGGNLGVSAFARSLRLRLLGPGEYAHLDPYGMAFANVNTPEDLAAAERFLGRTKTQTPGEGLRS